VLFYCTVLSLLNLTGVEILFVAVMNDIDTLFLLAITIMELWTAFKKIVTVGRTNLK